MGNSNSSERRGRKDSDKRWKRVKRWDILIVAVEIATVIGYRNVTRTLLAAKAGIAPGTVSYKFGSMKKLHDAIVAHAVDKSLLPIVAQALANGHPLAETAPVRLKQDAARSLTA